MDNKEFNWDDTLIDELLLSLGYTDASNRKSTVTHFKKLKQVENNKEPLFISEDGKSIYEETEKVWIVGGDLTIGEHKAIAAKAWHERWAGGYIFSTKEKAELYVCDNKPCLSYSHIMNLYMNSRSSKPFGEQLKELVKEKINQK